MSDLINKENISRAVWVIAWIVLMLCLVLSARYLFLASEAPEDAPARLFFGFGSPPALLREIAEWFDPVFLQYNVLMVTFSVLIIPLITWIYTVRMKGEKRRRLERSLDKAGKWNEANRKLVERQIESFFNLRNFFGSMST